MVNLLFNLLFSFVWLQSLTVINLNHAQTIAPWVFVIDDTGSMFNEIAAIKRFIETLITDIEDGGETPEYFVLSQFDDPEHFANSYPTSSQFLVALNSIAAAGGGDCPEYGMSGIEEALQFIPPVSGSDDDTIELFFFTDAGQKVSDPFGAQTLG